MSQRLIDRPVTKALFSQCIGAVGTLICWIFIPALSLYTHGVWVALVLFGIFAAMAGIILFALPVWWLFINAVFPVALFASNSLALPGWSYLVAFFLCLAVFWNVSGERVPLYLSNRTTWQALDQLLGTQTGLVFLDVGSGIGGTLRYLAKANPQNTFIGVENAPGPYFISWFRQKLWPLENLDFHYGDFWQYDLSRFDMVYCFLSPEPMPHLFGKARQEMKSNALLISNSFSVPGYEPHQIIQLGDSRKTRLQIWKF